MQAFVLYMLALGAGVSVAVQGVVNGGLRTALGSPAWAAFVSYVGGLLSMLVVLLVLREHVPSWKTVANTDLSIPTARHDIATVLTPSW